MDSILQISISFSCWLVCMRVFCRYEVIRDGLSQVDRMQGREVEEDVFEPVTICGCTFMLPVQRITDVFGHPFSFKWFIPKPYGKLRRRSKTRRK